MNVKTAYNAVVKTSLVILILFSAGCVTVPKETVELSYTLGNDIESLHHSYSLLIKEYFESLRMQVNNSIDKVYLPAYIGYFIKNGKLIEYTKNERYDLVELWARIAVENIDKIRKERLAPVYTAEKDLMTSVDDAFKKAVMANSAITAYLNSIRSIDEVQKELLDYLNLKGIKEKINNALAAASDETKKINGQIQDLAASLKPNVNQ